MILFSLVLHITCVSLVTSLDLPPKTGKFFYSELLTSDEFSPPDSLIYMPVAIGATKT